MSKPPPLPPWIVAWGTVLLGALLALHVIFDMLSTTYSNPTLSLALLGGFCTALGAHNALRPGGGDRE